MQVRYLLFWDVGIMDPIRCPVTSVANYQLTPCNIAEERRLWWERLSKHMLRGFIKIKFSRYRPGVAQRLCRGIALLFHDRGTRREWVASSKPRPHFTPGKDPVPIVEEAGWAPGPVWNGGKSRPHRDSISDRPACSQSLYRMSYPAQSVALYYPLLMMWSLFQLRYYSRVCLEGLYRSM